MSSSPPSSIAPLIRFFALLSAESVPSFIQSLFSRPPPTSIAAFARPAIVDARMACSSVAPAPFASAKLPPVSCINESQYDGSLEIRRITVSMLPARPELACVSVPALEVPSVNSASAACGSAAMTPVPIVFATLPAFVSLQFAAERSFSESDVRWVYFAQLWIGCKRELVNAESPFTNFPSFVNPPFK